MNRAILTAALALVFVTGGLAALAWQQEPQRPEARAQEPPQKGQRDYPDLVKGLRETPGCLGVETAQTASGKQVIFAWFESKEACLNWFYSDMHQKVMHTFFDEAGQHEPLADIPDDLGPILAIASLTPTDKPQFEGLRMPVSQIAIELYQPLTGGLSLGGRFAPDTLQVPGLKDYSSEDAAAPPPAPNDEQQERP